MIEAKKTEIESRKRTKVKKGEPMQQEKK